MRKAKHYKAKKQKYTNILCVLASLMAGMLGVVVLEDGTALLMAVIFAVPLLFSKKHIYY